MRALSYITALALLTSCGALKSSLRDTPSIQEVSELPWVEVQTDHFLIRTTLSAETAEGTARQLERFRRALLLLWGPNVNPAERIEVVLLRNFEELQAVTDSRTAGYLKYRRTDPHLLVLSAKGYVFGEASVQMNLLAHVVLREVVTRPPKWLGHGLANYLETTRIKADGTVEMGRVNENLYEFLHRHRRPTIPALWAWEPSRREGTIMYSATSWALVHYLFNNEPRRFVDYLKRIAAHESHDDAWAAAFPGLTPAQLNRKLNVHLKRGRGVLIELPMPPLAVNAVVVPMNTEEVHTTLARLLLTSPGTEKKEEREKLAREQLEAALQANPDHTPAKQLREALEQSEAN